MASIKVGSFRPSVLLDVAGETGRLASAAELLSPYLPSPGPEGGDLLDSALDRDSGLVHR